MTQHKSVEAGFTPGPWEIFRLNARNGLLTVGISGPFGPRKHIAEICWAKDVADKETGATGLDDAHLIAVAPALYSALENVVDLLVRTVSEFGCWNAEDHPKVIAARAALASARGNQS